MNVSKQYNYMIDAGKRVKYISGPLTYTLCHLGTVPSAHEEGKYPFSGSNSLLCCNCKLIQAKLNWSIHKR